MERNKNWRDDFSKSIHEMVGETAEKRREHWLKFYKIKEDEYEKMEVFNKFLEFKNNMLAPAFIEYNSSMTQDEISSYYRDCHNNRLKLMELCGKDSVNTHLLFGGYIETDEALKKEIKNGE